MVERPRSLSSRKTPAWEPISPSDSVVDRGDNPHWEIACVTEREFHISSSEFSVPAWGRETESIQGFTRLSTGGLQTLCAGLSDYAQHNNRNLTQITRFPLFSRENPLRVNPAIRNAVSRLEFGTRLSTVEQEQSLVVHAGCSFLELAKAAELLSITSERFRNNQQVLFDCPRSLQDAAKIATGLAGVTTLRLQYQNIDAFLIEGDNDSKQASIFVPYTLYESGDFNANIKIEYVQNGRVVRRSETMSESLSRLDGAIAVMRGLSQPRSRS